MDTIYVYEYIYPTIKEIINASIVKYNPKPSNAIVITEAKANHPQILGTIFYSVGPINRLKYIREN